MSRSLKSYAGFFCPMSPVSSLLTNSRHEDDYDFYTQDRGMTSAFETFHRNLTETNLMCAWELIYGKHYHYLHELLLRPARSSKGALDYLIFPLVARGLFDLSKFLFSSIGENFAFAMCLVVLLIPISSLIITLECTRLILGLPLVLAAWGIITGVRTLCDEADEISVINSLQLNDLIRETQGLVEQVEVVEGEEAQLDAWRYQWR